MRILCPERAFPQLVQLGVIAGCVLLDRIRRNASLCFAFVAHLASSGIARAQPQKHNFTPPLLR